MFWFGALHNWVAPLSQQSVKTTKTKQKETGKQRNATTEFQHLSKFIILVSWIFKMFFNRIKWWNVTVIWPKLQQNRCKIDDFFILLQFINELQTPCMSDYLGKQKVWINIWFKFSMLKIFSKKGIWINWVILGRY